MDLLIKNVDKNNKKHLIIPQKSRTIISENKQGGFTLWHSLFLTLVYHVVLVPVDVR